MWTFSSCSEWAFHCSGFSYCRAQALGTWASLVAAYGFSSCGAQAYLLHSMWNLARIEPMSPALAGEFLTTVPSGWRRQWQPTPVLLPGKSHGQRSLVGCIPWGCEELDTTEKLHFPFLLSCIGEGNGNPLQCSCLENPRDGGASWAAVYGVAQSRTRLK